MTTKTLIGPWIRRFLLEYIIGERNFTKNTQQSYRDTLTIFLSFLTKHIGRPIDRICIEDVSPDSVRQFLKYLEESRNCSNSSRNQRLAAIRSLAHFIGMYSPEHIAWCGQIREIPFKKGKTSSMSYLEKDEMDALLVAPDRSTSQGRRDYGMLLFLYNSGARADEAAHIKIRDIIFSSPASVKILGKGNKIRICPLWPITASILSEITEHHDPDDRVFLNRRGQPITRFGIYEMVERYVSKVTVTIPALGNKRISPHTIRHTTAVHLLRAGVDINTIRAWLGHASLNTTNVYAEVDLEMKAKALAKCDVKARAKNRKRWRENDGLMAFLRSL